MRSLPSLSLALLIPAAAAAQDPRIDQAVERLTPAITEIRHQFHQHPELGNRAEPTCAERPS